MLWERVLLLSSVSASQNCHRMLHFLLLLCRKVVGGRKTASKMSAKRLYEQARATLRTKQRGTDGRVKEHKRQRKQIHTHSLSLSVSLSLFLSFSSLCFCHHIFFIWIDLLFKEVRCSFYEFSKPIRFCSNLVETLFNPFPIRKCKKNWGSPCWFSR